MALGSPLTAREVARYEDMRAALRRLDENKTDQSTLSDFSTALDLLADYIDDPDVSHLIARLKINPILG